MRVRIKLPKADRSFSHHVELDDVQDFRIDSGALIVLTDAGPVAFAPGFWMMFEQMSEE